MKKTLLFVLLALLLPIVANAYVFESGGIYYNINEDETSVSVTFNGNNSYSGSVVIPSTVTYNSTTYSVTIIGDQAFYRCTGLTSVTIPNSVTSIGDNAFRESNGLTSITIPNSVTSIGTRAFYNCSGLTSITIPNSVTSIGYYAFYGCSGLTSVTIGNSVTSIGHDAFYNCSGLTSVTINSNNLISKTYTSSNNFTTIFGSQVKEYILGDDIKSIGNYAFYNCSSLTSITIPNSVTSIGGYAFSGCSGLTSVTIPNSVTSIGERVFNGCTNLTFVAIPNSVTSIGASAFHNCSNLIYVAIPNSVTSIGNFAFSNCSGLTSVTIGNSVTSIGGYAFYNCSCLTSITIPNSVTSIGQNAFSGCRGLTSITIPNSVTSIGQNAFSNCSGLTKAEFASIESLCKIQFGNNESNPLYNAKHLYINGQEITDLVIPESVTSIGEYAFNGCTGLTSITIPNSVTSIGSYAFTECPLQTIVNHGNKDVKKDTFYDRVYLHTQLYVPEGTAWDYIFNTGWGEFHHIKEFASKADDIRNDAVYMIADRSGRNFPVFDKATKSLKNVAYTLNIDDSDTGACWQVKKNGGDTYLYNIGAGMYASYDVDNNLALSIAPTAVNIDVTEDGATINGRPVMLVANKSLTPVGPEYILGDANGNGVVEIGDVTSVLTLMATPEATGYNNKAADANENGEIEIGDVTTILTIMAEGD